MSDDLQLHITSTERDARVLATYTLVPQNHRRTDTQTLQLCNIDMKLTLTGMQCDMD